MTRWSVRLCLLTLPILSLSARPAIASSVTSMTALSVNLLGNEGLSASCTDKPDTTGPAYYPGDGATIVNDNGKLVVYGAGTTPPDMTTWKTPTRDNTAPPPSAATSNETVEPTVTDAPVTDEVEVPVVVPDAVDPIADDSATVDPVVFETTAPPQVASTPEPASLTLLALGGLGGMYARRRKARG